MKGGKRRGGEGEGGEFGMTDGGRRRGGGEGEGGMMEGGKRRGRGGEGEEGGDPMMDGGSRRGKGKGDEGILVDGGKRSTRPREPDPSDPNYKIHHARFVLENTIKEFMQDNAMILGGVDFVHLRAGKCTLNGKRINVKMNDAGKLQVGEWQLEDFIKEYGKKKKVEDPTKDNRVVGGAMPGMLSGGSEEAPPEPSVPKAPARLAALPAIATTTGRTSAPASLPPVNLPLARHKLAPLPKINKPAT
eukprot:Phypoly_transcript_17845.p1 GENE.Phypoly_transcript_17845~~Phypoly_transcript_17845.p1  ORF type:complete len:246 (+),score=76.06 Phypoly_transcript_17845:1-738(+)